VDPAARACEGPYSRPPRWLKFRLVSVYHQPAAAPPDPLAAAKLDSYLLPAQALQLRTGLGPAIRRTTRMSLKLGGYAYAYV